VTLRVAADIGGTFTDIVAADDDGRVWRRKVASTPDDFGRGTVEGVLAAVADAGVAPKDVTVVVHATTVATNAILEGRGASTALLTTRGFRDVLELRRAASPVLYDHFWRPPPPLVPRHLRFEVDERTLADGSIETPVDEASVASAVDAARTEHVEAIALAFPHAYRNPSNEERAAALVRQLVPDTYVSVSSAVLPEMGEYERTSTTVINAYVGPTVSRYLAALAQRLRDSGVAAPVFLMQSNGSVLALEAARERPAAIVESGPAAGVIGAARLAVATGRPDLITLDMGGTTTKASLIEGGRPTQTSEYEVGGGISTVAAMARGRGYALRLPVLDLAEIGAGGGSIVRVTAGGGIAIGPQSAGAVPGPAAYGLGGADATVADATLVLGYLNPGRIAGGAVALQPDLAVRAVEQHVARPLGFSAEAAAHGVYRVAVATMARAVKAVTTFRGRSPTGFDLLAFGGNGPLFAVELARELEIGRVLVPVAAGLFSSVGLLDADEAVHLVRACPGGLRSVAPADVAAAFDDLATQAAAILGGSVDVRLERQADLRFRGQSTALMVPVSAPATDRRALLALGRAFAAEHARTYGYAPEHEPIELVNVRVVARRAATRSGLVALASPRRPVVASTDAPHRRRAYFGASLGWIDTPLLRRDELRAGCDGPLIVEEYDATTLVPPGASARTNDDGLIEIEVGA
jgi:N-methylhydantoinase A